ncbi:hypothetical protein F4779DRAFT_639609 [Xylariaceae sp. FL0662B]|nr:hypothetical protein F4779DRAFT_639609 [Xylariaceae sp. FL0662B]
MRFSKALKSSPHSIPSPDGKLIATLLPSSIAIRPVESLETTWTVKLPPDLAGGVTSFIWSPFSRRVLVAVADQIHVFSAKGGNFHAIVRMPSSPAKSPFVDFGATDSEACIWSPLGIKLTVINLVSSKAVEIANPKLYNASSASRGCAFRKSTHHLALLTRTAGKDVISIHSPGARDIERSWHPDTIDAQGLTWSPDGRWLVVWDSSAQGHRVLFFTSDGHLFKDWRGPLPLASREDMGQYGAGVKVVCFSPNGRHGVIADGSSCICILSTPSMVEEMRLRHPQAVQPRDTLQIWQEQNTLANYGSISSPPFVKATQAVIPPGLNSLQEPRCGCSLAKFDCSSTLLATRLDDAPSTIWIWDVPSSELRAVLMYHANVTKVEWHPAQPELLLMRCEGDRYGSLVFVWDPLSDGPRLIDMTDHFPGVVSGKTSVTWLETSTESAAIFFTDNETCMLVSLADSDGEKLPWGRQSTPPKSINHEAAMNADVPSRVVSPSDDSEIDNSLDMDDGMSEVEDTFQFKLTAP